MKPSQRNKWLLISVVLATVGVTLGFQLRSTTRAGGSNVGRVIRQDLIQRVTVAGTVVPFRKIIVTPPYNGYVKKLFVKVGQRVSAGDPIVSVSESLLNPNEELYPLRAPYGGTVVQINRAEGEFVTQSEGASGSNVIVRIDDTSKLFIESNAPEFEVTKLKIGQEAQIKAPAIFGRNYKGRIQSIALAAKEQQSWDRTKVEFPLRIEVMDFDLQLNPGMSVIVDVFAHKEPNVLTLRHEFIQKDKDAYYATLKEGGRVLLEVGLQNEEIFEIKGGLKEDDEVMQTDFLSYGVD